MPPNRHLIDSKWAFKEKLDGQLRASLVAWGYTKILGVDFTKNYSPVVPNVTLRVILLMWLVKNWDSETIDVETASLYTLLEEEIYMKIPEEIEE